MPRLKRSPADLTAFNPSKSDMLGKPVAVYFRVEHSDRENFTVNANCICKVIYEYIRLKAGIPDQLEFDLCDEDGNPLQFYETDEGAFGREFFDHKKTYYIILLERTNSGFLFNPRIQLHADHPDFQRLMGSAMGFFERLSTLERKMRKSGKRKMKLPDKAHRSDYQHHSVVF